MSAAFRRCEFCRIELVELKLGRPRRFCSKRCRQGDYRERNGLVRLNVWRRRRRRIDARVDAELERLALDEATSWAERENVRDEARERASQAWPQPERLEDWSSYVATIERSEAIAGDDETRSGQKGVSSP